MKNISPRDMVLVSMFAALAAVGAFIFRWLGSAVVPFSIVPFVAILAGSVLGPRLGALSMLVYLLLGLVGVPVFEKPPYGTPIYVLQPTFGFIAGFIGAAFVSGFILFKKNSPGLFRYILATIAGTLIIYLIGLPYLYVILNFYLGQGMPLMGVLKVGFIPFITWDIIKAVIAAALARIVHLRLYEGNLDTGKNAS